MFDGQTYTIERVQSASFKAPGARDQLTFSVEFGTKAFKTAADAEKALRLSRDLLPN